MMKKLSLEDLFEIGTRLLKEEKYGVALDVFKNIIKKGGYENAEEIPPKYLSYLGLALALSEKKFRNGAAFCEKAIKKESYNPVFYLNLGKVLLAGGYKRKAIHTFNHGLKMDEGNIEIRAELHKIGIRHKPIVPFLPRAHGVNKYLGLLFYKM